MYFGALGRDGALQLIAGINSDCSQLAGRRPLEGQLKLKLSGWMWYGGYVRSCRTFWVTGVALPKTEGLRWSNAFSKTAKTVECCTRQIQNILEQARFLQNKMWNSETRIACVFESLSLIPANHKDICVLHDSSCSGDVSIPFIFHVLFPLQRESDIPLPLGQFKDNNQKRNQFFRSTHSYRNHSIGSSCMTLELQKLMNKNSSPCLVRRRDSQRRYVCVHAKLLQSYLTLCDPMDCSPTGSSVHGVLQARKVEWVAVASCRGSSRPRDWTHISYVSRIGRQVLYH